ncbi:MAG TPA: penicillin-binding protein 1C [Bacteroidota bacterium]|nr:penicillin-binding protein 1C [Bacteroidota bacterium]
MRRFKAIALWSSLSCLAIVATFSLLSAFYPLPAQKPYSLIVEDRNGRLLHAFLADDGKWRLKTSPDEIPARLKRILIQKEDRYFYYHPGINPFSIARAAFQNIIHRRRVSGASTITMQVARMMEPKRRTYLNKLVEVFRAVQLELKYSKKEILEMYLSSTPLGGNIEGLKSAAYVYYQTPIERLNIAQLFDLILIPNDPNDLRPDKNPDKLFSERMRLAREWMHEGLLSRRDSQILWQTPAGATRNPLPAFAPHFCLRIKEGYAGQPVYHSSLDLRIQRIVEGLLSGNLKSWRDKGVQNSAALVVRNSTREIIAYVGSENFDDIGARGQVDAVKAIRSPGSTLKPLLYALSMERGELTPKTRLLDVPYDVEGFTAENYDGTYSGPVYADEALRRSLNIPMIRLLSGIGTAPFVDFLQTTGMSSLRDQRDRLGLSIITGGCGVTLEELVGAYAAFPNGGTYVRPSFAKQITVPAEEQKKKTFSVSTAFMVTEILAGLDRPDIPNNFESSLNLPKVAYKTGTSYGRRDAWAIGYSAEYTIGVWVGNVTNKGNADLAGSKAAAPLLIAIVNSISASHQKEILHQPVDLLKREVCATSGKLPNQNCRHLIEDYYSVVRTQDRVCDVDREYMVSDDARITYCPSCLGNHRYRTATFENQPPELLSFWASMGKSTREPPPHNPECSTVLSGEGPRILSPSRDMTYYILSKDQTIVLQAASAIDVGQHIWYVDDSFLERTRPGERRFISLNDGEHTIACMDERGRMSTITITVRYVP